MFIDLIEGTALLLALCLLHGFIGRRWRHGEAAGDVASGLLFGGICVVGMMTPVVLSPGAIFDGRSVVLAMAGLFGGPLAGFVAAAVAAAYRLWLGGPGAWIGCGVIVTCVLLGLAYRQARARRLIGVEAAPLLAFGLVVHLACILWFLLFPPEILARVLDDIAVPFVLTLTPATAILGFLLRDAERRTEIERSLAISEERLRAIANALPDLVLLVDEDGCLAEVLSLAATEKLLQAEVAHVLGSNMRDVLPPADAETLLAVVRRTLDSGEPQTVVFELNMRRGPVILEGRTSPLKALAGGKRSVVFATRDISESRRNEDRLRRVQRMEAVGQVAGGVAHDFNNILGIVQGNLELLREMASGNPKIADRVDKAMAALDRATAITRKLLGFAHRGTGGVRRTLVNDFIRNVAELFGKSPMAAIQVSLDLAEDLWPVNVDAGDLQDVVLNLALNARDAMPNGGRLVIRTANAVLTADEAAQGHPPGAAGEFAMIAVEDDGEGMSEAVKEKIFEPFFSTKPTGKGTGLGLSMVYGFVQRSQGLIRVETTLGRGTVFRLYLPRVLGETTAAGAAPEAAAGAAPEAATRRAAGLRARPASAPPASTPRGTECVLIVDDEADLVDVAEQYLTSLGYRTLTANDGPQALDLLRSGAPIDLLFSDVVMPGGYDGFRLAEEAMRLQPGLKVLLASGYSAAAQAQGGYDHLSGLAANLMKKPYDQAALARAVRRTLDEPPVEGGPGGPPPAP